MRRNYSVGAAKALCEPLKQLAHKHGPGAKLPTREELCGLLNTNPATLHSALRELEAGNVIYSRRGSGIFVSPKLYQKNVRIFFNANLISRAGLSPFWGMFSGLILGEAQRRAAMSQTEYRFELADPSHFHDPATVDSLIRSYREALIHGMIAVGMGEHPDHPAIDATVPVVTYADFGNWQVEADIPHGAHLGFEALVGMGARKLAIWTHFAHDMDGPDGRSYLTALEAVVKSHALPYDPDLTHGPRTFLGGDPSVVGLTYQEQGYLMARHVFSGDGAKPDGLLLGDDMIAQGVLTALQHIGVRPGVDVRIVSTCNAGSPMLYGYEDMLAFVEYDPAKLATALFDVLHVLMSGRVPEQDQMLVKPRLFMPGERTRRAEIMECYGMQ
jgi:DNA-binding LacI/PurR family transcriptional regulator